MRRFSAARSAHERCAPHEHWHRAPSLPRIARGIERQLDPVLGADHEGERAGILDAVGDEAVQEQLLGFYLVECASKDEAIVIARELSAAVPVGSYEIRPLRGFSPDRRAK